MQSEASKPVKLMFRPRDITSKPKLHPSVFTLSLKTELYTFQNWSEAICILLPFGAKWEKIKTSHAG